MRKNLRVQRHVFVYNSKDNMTGGQLYESYRFAWKAEADPGS